MQSSVNDPVSSDLYVYPNPGNGVFRIRMDKQKESMTVRIINSQGQLVYIRMYGPGQLNNEVIDVRNLPRGIYYLLLESKEQLLRGKIVIE
jgi:hypothetical protein